MPEKEGFVVLIGHRASCLWYGGETPEPIFWENVKKWCYLDDLLALETELERTRKVLKIAVKAIETIQYSKYSDAINLRHKANKALVDIYKIKKQNSRIKENKDE